MGVKGISVSDYIGYKTDIVGMAVLLMVSIYQVPHFFGRLSLGFLAQRVARFGDKNLESVEPYDDA